ncbi:MAG: hypothetical protein OXU61_11405, partial [Gammaproteobacteria bacterium]|nr:hypothetical protein [Gammaproteobacteria bacterium]
HSCESRNPAYQARASRSFMTARGKGGRAKIRAVACWRQRANVRVPALYLCWIPAPVQARGRLCAGMADIFRASG